MDQVTFIYAAYILTATLIVALCLSTWLRARRTNARLNKSNSK